MKLLITLFLLVVTVIAVAGAGIYLGHNPGRVTVEWEGFLVDTSVGVLIIAVILLMGVAAILYRLWRWIISAPGAFARGRDRNRRIKGYQALTQGMVAVAAGDPDSASRMSRRADQLLKDPPLTMLLAAQAAQLSGDERAARRYFERMLDQPETEFLALRGLLNEALRADDTIKALELAQRARRIRPNTPWVIRIMLDLQVRMRRWVEAQESLTAAVRARLIDATTAKRQKAAILVERSREAETAGDQPAALSLAHQAVNLQAGFAPAVVREARMLAQAGRDKQAIRLIEKAWARMPHRDLADVMLGLDPDADPLVTVRRVEKLHAARPEHRESRIALAQAQIAADLFAQAREHLLAVAESSPTRRVYRLLADLEAAETQNAEAARAWLLKADDAASEEAWVCRVCGTVSPVWRAVCGNCGTFESHDWAAPTVAVHSPTIEALPESNVGTLPPVAVAQTS